MTISKEIAERLKQSGQRYWAGDNISDVLHEGDKELLIEELTPKFEAVLDGLVIDRYNDPNSMGTGRRLAKMYFNELSSYDDNNEFPSMYASEIFSTSYSEL